MIGVFAGCVVSASAYWYSLALLGVDDRERRIFAAVAIVGLVVVALLLQGSPVLAAGCDAPPSTPPLNWSYSTPDGCWTADAVMDATSLAALSPGSSPLGSLPDADEIMWESASSSSDPGPGTPDRTAVWTLADGAFATWFSEANASADDSGRAVSLGSVSVVDVYNGLGLSGPGAETVGSWEGAGGGGAGSSSPSWVGTDAGAFSAGFQIALETSIGVWAAMIAFVVLRRLIGAAGF